MKAYVRTFGCRANQYDSEVVRGLIEAAGGEIVDTPAAADVAIFNSCTVTADAEADLRRAVRGASRPSIVMGCASARAPEAVGALPNVTHVVQGADVAAVAIALGLPASAVAAAAAARPGVQTGARALLRIQDGCDEHCTFCATTLARGANRSRPAEDVVAEARALAETHPEIVVTGIHIGSYGVDAGSSLGLLVERLIADIPDVRFRLTSIEATEVDDRLAALYAGDQRRLAPHLHAPLQSGSDAVLRRMGRHWYTAASYARAVERLASRVAPIALAADIITGFPGETAADHAATVALVRDLPFTSLHVFPYSPRPGTPATRLERAVPPALARDRAAELRALGAAKAAAHRASRAGGTADVVVVGDGARRHGLTEDYLSVQLSDPAMPRRSRFDAELVLRDTGLVAMPLAMAKELDG
ncbi:MAG: MiaB/RimO family radical SAM methylthiotransferase [Gemmatimonadetes bacterium]|nr:MiaB/RimO family radical SAM methylthiotransferase [Gemmatimonadota bacterium]